ncbi:MAG TPA: glycosyltransferase family 2 protein [Gemmataceae bacterium]|jgi:GT2 family glycosyltransferase|nr:glycosyltransferase family 2 protein [Gemmataceae bacterium]
MALALLAQPVLVTGLKLQNRRQKLRKTVVYATKPRLSVIIVNYRQWKETAALTRQILATSEACRQEVEVIIIDNHSPSHRVISRLRRLPGVSLRRWKRNRGFARAVNEGCRLSRGDWFLLLNPDMSLKPGFIKGVLEQAEQLQQRDPKTRIVGFQLHNSDGSLQLSSGSFPTLGGILTRLWKPRRLRKYLVPPTDHPTEVAWVTGCCLLINRTCFKELGGLDEDYFLYYEDVDFCRRARALGWKVRYDPGLQAIHHHPLHSRRVSTSLRLFTRHALLVYGWKHWPRWQFRLLSRIVQLEAWAKQGWNSIWGRNCTAKKFRELQAITQTISQKGPKKVLMRLNKLAD